MSLRVGFFVYEIDRRVGMQRQASLLLPRLRDAGLDLRVVSTASPKDLPRLRGRPAPGAPDLPLTRLAITRPGVFETLATTWLTAQGGVDVLLGLGWHEALHAARIASATRLPFVARYACSGSHGDMAALAEQPRALRRLLQATRHVCISEEILSELRAAGFPSERLVSIPNGVDLAAWARPVAPAELPFPPESEVLLFVGRLTEQKRADVLLAALARLAPARPQLRLALIGEGPLRAELEAQAARLGLSERVAFLGVTPDVLPYHRAARAFVLPSEGEGLPNALLEALAAGTPTVATAVPGTRDVCRDGQEALLVPVGDPDALAGSIGRLLDEPQLCEGLRAAAQARVRARYDVDEAARSYAEVLREAAAERPGRRTYRLLSETARRLRPR